MTRPVRIGAVNYLNTKPLIHELEVLAPEAELVLDVPSRLADLLADARLDVALIPAIEYFRAGGYTILPNIAIASRGPVLSVTLFSRVPWANLRRVALDEGSRTSAALCQILLRKRYGVSPELRAFWAVRDGAELGGVAEALGEAKRRGSASIGQIAHREAPRLGLDAGFCRRYLGNIIHFDLGPREQAGLHHYYMLACELGLARRGVSLDFYGHAHLAESR